MSNRTVPPQLDGPLQLEEALEPAPDLQGGIVQLLEEMGLSTKETEIYSFLLIGGDATPSAIARQTGLPRGRIYEAMRNLVAKGFARERPTRPIMFCATPMADVLATSQARLTRHLQVIKMAQAIAPGAAAAGRPPATPMRMRDVRVVSGRRACYAEVLRMIETASQFFWMSGGGRFAGRLSNMPMVLDALKTAASRGVDVRIMLLPSQAVGRAVALIDMGRDVPVLHDGAWDDAGPLVLCANESASLEMIAQPDDEAPTRGDDVAIQVANPLFAAALKRRLDRPAQEPAAGAPPWPWVGPKHDSDPFAAAIEGATSDVQVLGPPEWGTYMRAAWARGAALHTAAAKRGVRMRVVATHDAASPKDFVEFQTSWNVRLVGTLPMWLTIVDGRELHQAFPHPTLGGVPQFRRSTEPNELRFYQGIFERLWNTGSPASKTLAAPHSGAAPAHLLEDGQGSSSAPGATTAIARALGS